MVSEKELAYGVALGMSAEKVMQSYAEMAKEKDEQMMKFAIFLSVSIEEFKAGFCKRTIEGEELTLQVADLYHVSLISIAGCGKELRVKFEALLKKYKNTIKRARLEEEIKNLKLSLEDAYIDCLGDDRGIDINNLREQVMTFFKFVDMYQFKNTVDVTKKVDDAVERLKETMGPSKRR